MSKYPLFLNCIHPHFPLQPAYIHTLKHTSLWNKKIFRRFSFPSSSPFSNLFWCLRIFSLFPSCSFYFSYFPHFPEGCTLVSFFHSIFPEGISFQCIRAIYRWLDWNMFFVFSLNFLFSQIFPIFFLLISYRTKTAYHQMDVE